MIKVTDAAREALLNYTQQNNRKDVKIIVAGYG